MPLDPHVRRRVTRVVVDPRFVEAAEVRNREHRPLFAGALQAERRLGVVQDVVDEAFLVIAGEVVDRRFGRRIPELEAKQGRAVDGRLCGPLERGAEPVAAQLRKIGVVPDQHDAVGT
jgi:hypothetical protein